METLTGKHLLPIAPTPVTLKQMRPIRLLHIIRRQRAGASSALLDLEGCDCERSALPHKVEGRKMERTVFCNVTYKDLGETPCRNDNLVRHGLLQHRVRQLSRDVRASARLSRVVGAASELTRRMLDLLRPDLR